MIYKEARLAAEQRGGRYKAVGESRGCLLVSRGSSLGDNKMF